MDTNNIKRAIEKHIIALVFSGFAAISAAVVMAFPKKTTEQLLSILPAEYLLKVTILLLLVVLIESAYILYLHRKKLKPAFGLLWDKSKNPYCPACEVLLGQYGHYGGQKFKSLKCAKCGKLLVITDDTGETIDLIAAKNRLI